MNQSSIIKERAPLFKRADFRSVCDKCGNYITAGDLICITWNNPDSVTWTHATETACT